MSDRKLIQAKVYVADGTIQNTKGKYGLLITYISRFTTKSKFYNSTFKNIRKIVDELPEKMTLDFASKLEDRVCRMIIVDNMNDYPENDFVTYAVKWLAINNRIYNVSGPTVSGDNFLKYAATNMMPALNRCGTPFVTNNRFINALSAITSDIDEEGYNRDYPDATGSVIDILFTHHNNVHEAYPEMQMAIDSHHVLQAHVDYISDVGFQMFLNYPDLVPQLNFNATPSGYMIYCSKFMLSDEIFDKFSMCSFKRNSPNETVFSRLPMREQYRMAWRLRLTNPRGLPIDELLNKSQAAQQIVNKVQTGDINYDHLEEIYLYVIYYNVDPNHLSHIYRQNYKSIFTILPLIPELSKRKEYPESFGPQCFWDFEKAFNMTKEHIYCWTSDDHSNRLLRLFTVYGPLVSYSTYVELQIFPENCLKLLCMMKGLPLIAASLHNGDQCMVALTCGVLLPFDHYITCHALYQPTVQTKITNIIVSKLCETLPEGGILDANLDVICKYHNSELFRKLYGASRDELLPIFQSMGINFPQYYAGGKDCDIIEVHTVEDVLENVLLYFELYINLRANDDNVKEDRIDSDMLKYYTDKQVCKKFNFSEDYSRSQLFTILGAIHLKETVCFLHSDQERNTVTWYINGNCVKFSISEKLDNIIDEHPIISFITYKMVDPKEKFETTRLLKQRLFKVR